MNSAPKSSSLPNTWRNCLGFKNTSAAQVPEIRFQKVPQVEHFRHSASSLKVWRRDKPHWNTQSSEYQPHCIVKRDNEYRDLILSDAEQLCSMLDLSSWHINYSNLLSLLDSSLISWNGHQDYWFIGGGGEAAVNAGFKQSLLKAQFDNPFQAFI